MVQLSPQRVQQQDTLLAHHLQALQILLPVQTAHGVHSLPQLLGRIAKVRFVVVATEIVEFRIFDLNLDVVDRLGR